jgi:hypothetical protein
MQPTWFSPPASVAPNSLRRASAAVPSRCVSNAFHGRSQLCSAPAGSVQLIDTSGASERPRAVAAAGVFIGPARQLVRVVCDAEVVVGAVPLGERLVEQQPFEPSQVELRAADQYNEGVDRDIMRVQARLGQHTAVPRTLALLAATLALLAATLGEIDEEPSADTRNLAELRQPLSATSRS